MASQERTDAGDADAVLWSDGATAEASQALGEVNPGGAMEGLVGLKKDRAVTEHRADQARGWFSVPCRISSFINWKRPFRTSALFAAVNTVFWSVAFVTFRAYCLLFLFLAVVVTMTTLRDPVVSRTRGTHLWHWITGSWKMINPGQTSGSEMEPPFSDSFRLFLQETSSFKQQNPGKFCLLVCSLCTFLALLGRYIPGVIISYILILGVFLWPLLSSQEIGLRLKPVLQKLDFGIGEFFKKIKDNHERRLLQAAAEKESIEADLSSLFPKLDSTVCKEMMSISDTDVSDATWTDNGIFNLSEAHTPQTDNSEDLDKEEGFTGGLPEFPSLDNGGTNGDDDDDDLSLGLPTPSPHPRQPIKSKRMPLQHQEPTNSALDLVNQMAGDAIAAAVTAAIQQRIEAAVGATLFADAPSRSRHPERTSLPPLELAEESDSSEAEDFELLDQSELEQLDGELGLAVEPSKALDEGQDQPSQGSTTAGFFSKLLGRP